VDHSDYRRNWQLGELKKYLEANKEDPLLNSRRVCLVNPEQRKEVNNIILQYLWPAVIKGMGSGGLWIRSLKNGYPKADIEDKQYPYSASELIFLLEDPKRPLSFDSTPPWYCRGTITCSVLDYLLSFDFMVYFPESFSIFKILRLLKNPMFAGNPPDLSYNTSPDGTGIYVVSFSRGSGAGWGINSYTDAAGKIIDEIRQNIKIIHAIYDLERDFKNTKKFNTLEKALINLYASY